MPLVRCLLAIALCTVSLDAWCHEYWGNGREVDTATKQLCCGQNDCLDIPPEKVHARSDGFFHFDDTNLIVDIGRAMPSPDGHVWRCIWGGEIKCLFMPPSGS